MADMNSFPMLHGNVKHVSYNIMSLCFKPPWGDESVAVAVTGVCFIGDKLSMILYHDFKPKDRVAFSAVKDQLSVNPDVWKAVAVWTSRKPRNAFKIQDWDSAVSQLYPNVSVISNILMGKTFHGKNIYAESRILKSLFIKIKCDLAEHVSHKRVDDDLDQLLYSDDDANYIELAYGSMANYFSYHENVFRFSKAGKIFPARSRSLDEYLKVTLPNKIKEEEKQKYGMEEKDACETKDCAEEKEVIQGQVFDCSQENQLDERKNYSQIDKDIYIEEEQEEQNTEDDQLSEYSYCSGPIEKSESKIFQLEKEGVAFFHSLLKTMYQESGYVCCLWSSGLEKLMGSSPEHIQIYIRNTYNNLSTFIQSHNCAFIIGHDRTIIASTTIKLDKYLSNELKDLFPDDACNFELYQKFMKEHSVSSDTLKSSGEADSMKLFTNLALEEIYYSDEEDGLPEIKDLRTSVISKMDAYTQTLSSGPILSMLQCID